MTKIWFVPLSKLDDLGFHSTGNNYACNACGFVIAAGEHASKHMENHAVNTHLKHLSSALSLDNIEAYVTGGGGAPAETVSSLEGKLRRIVGVLLTEIKVMQERIDELEAELYQDTEPV